MKRRVVQPVYLQIADDLRARIESEDWGPGYMLPSRSSLAREYGVALMTIQKAIHPLLEEGLLVASHRRGTFVAEKIHAILDAPSEEPSSLVKDGDGGDTPAHFEGFVIGVIGSFAFHADMSDTENWENQDAWSSRMVRGLINEATDLGGSTEVFNLHGTPDKEDTPIAQAIQHALDGGATCLVFVDVHGYKQYDRRIPPLLPRLDLPYVIMSGSSLDGVGPRVCIDEYQAGRAAAAHLLEVGYRKVVALPLYDFHWETMRIAGAKQVLGDALIMPSAEDIELLRPAYKQLRIPTRPERIQLHAEILDRMIGFDSLEPGEWAVLMPNDPAAVPLHSVLQQLGIKPGLDLGLIGFDDHSYASLLGITSVGQPLAQIGITTARLLCEAVRDGLDSVQAIVRCRVAARASTQRHPRGAKKL
ncbi:MAG: GntR family transcriptional regulator [Candidatus Latescibacterota bacterium]|jgi:DNA-binding LacI/PurR family transcriptional regulator/DNA-binding transcriptional regulator YhcF (GntR family)